MRLNVITGMPRSGSTLLCNVLNQNPDFHASSTSALPRLLKAITSTWSSSIEIKNLLQIDKEETEKRLLTSLRGFVRDWYEHVDATGVPVIFDKSRGWNHNALLLEKLFPEAKIIVMVRDLRNIFASIEKQHKKTPELVLGADRADTIYSRADSMFNEKNIIGSCITGVEDLIRRKIKNVIYVQYEAFSSNPDRVLKEIYDNIGHEPFKHDLENIKNTSVDPDGHYLNKYPHEGSGKIKACDVNEWQKYIDPELAQTIMKRFPYYNWFFGYK